MDKNKIIEKWNKSYSFDQEGLYNSFFVRLIFNKGHRYIASRGKNMHGTVLDVGSGVGYHLKFENLKSRKYICLDSNSSMLARIKNNKVKKINASCDKIPLKNKSINLIIASHILEHLSNLAKCLGEIERVLKDNGTLLVVLPCDPGYFWRFLTYFSPSRKRLKKSGLDYKIVMKHEHVNSFKQCVDKLKDHFTIQEEIFYPFGVKSYNFNIICGLKLQKKKND